MNDRDYCLQCGIVNCQCPKITKLEQKIESLFMSIHGIKPDEVDKFKERIESLEEKYQQILDSRSVWLTSIKTELLELRELIIDTRQWNMDAAYGRNQIKSVLKAIGNANVEVIERLMPSEYCREQDKLTDIEDEILSALEELSEGENSVMANKLGSVGLSHKRYKAESAEVDASTTDSTPSSIMPDRGVVAGSSVSNRTVKGAEDESLNTPHLTPSEVSEHDKKIMREMIPQADEIIYDYTTPSDTSPFAPLESLKKMSSPDEDKLVGVITECPMCHFKVYYHWIRGKDMIRGFRDLLKARLEYFSNHIYEVELHPNFEEEIKRILREDIETYEKRLNDEKLNETPDNIGKTAYMSLREKFRTLEQKIENLEARIKRGEHLVKKGFSELKDYINEHIKEIHTRSHNQAKKLESVLKESFERSKKRCKEYGDFDGMKFYMEQLMKLSEGEKSEIDAKTTSDIGGITDLGNIKTDSIPSEENPMYIPSVINYKFYTEDEYKDLIRDFLDDLKDIYPDIETDIPKYIQNKIKSKRKKWKTKLDD